MAFLGMRGTGNWVAGQRPEHWRQMILRLYPNGQAPLTAILSKMGEEKVDDPHYHWWTKGLPMQAGAITNIFTDAAFAVPYVAGGVAGQQIWINVAQLLATEFRHGHIVLLRDSSNLNVDVVGRVESVIINGANSAIAVTLLEADNNDPAGLNDLSDADRIIIIGNSNPEGGEMPDTVAYDPVEWYNYTQIFRTPLEITRTARRTRLRTGPQYQESKRECLELHSIEMEKAFLWGIRTLRTGHNNQPERTTLGLINAIRLGAPGNVFNYPTAAAYSGQPWLTGGEHWMDTCMEQIFRFGAKDKLGLIGSEALLAITRLAKAAGVTFMKPDTGNMTWGIAVQHWMTNFGTIHLITHPLFNYEPTMRNLLVITEPKLLKVRYIDDTTFFGEGTSKKSSQGHNFRRVDGTKEEFLTEIGLEYHHPTAMGVMTGLGQLNVV